MSYPEIRHSDLGKTRYPGSIMYVAYMDESYNASHFYLGAAIAPEAVWVKVADAYDSIRIATADLHGTPVDAEFHGHALMGGSEDWTAPRGKHREAAGVYHAALCAAENAGVKYIFEGVDVDRLNARYRYPKPPHEVVFGHILERIHEYADLVGCREPISVVADEVASQAQHVSQFIGYQQHGTPGYRSSWLGNLAPTVTFASSRERAGLQAADLAVYIHRRREDRTLRCDLRASKTVERLWDHIDPAIRFRRTWIP